MRGSHEFETVEVDWIDHATVKLKNSDGLVVYIDPWSDVFDGEQEKADVIVSTHDHFDHFDREAIKALEKKDTVLILTEDSEDDAPEEMETKVIRPGTSVEAHGHRFRGVEAYNVDKFREPDTPFHPKGLCTGVIFELDGLKFYHASDTDPIEEMEKLSEEKIDVAFMPAGGHYTMDQEEAIEAVKKVRPGKVVPIHYGYVDETTCDTEKFEEDITEGTDLEAFILEN